ncbi:MAG TPA: hypothetical protein VNJ08_07885 [Bacteriovoracaceae bacterium]|nr:hypothetical protein [Bacteriovoracaceae bacterium]
MKLKLIAGAFVVIAVFIYTLTKAKNKVAVPKTSQSNEFLKSGPSDPVNSMPSDPDNSMKESISPKPGENAQQIDHRNVEVVQIPAFDKSPDKEGSRNINEQSGHLTLQEKKAEAKARGTQEIQIKIQNINTEALSVRDKIDSKYDEWRNKVATDTAQSDKGKNTRVESRVKAAMEVLARNQKK